MKILSGESIPTEELCGGWLTKIDQYDLEFSSLSIQPNPFNNELNVSFDDQAIKNGKIRIFDLTGKQAHKIPVVHRFWKYCNRNFIS